jgi:hypothetical protein
MIIHHTSESVIPSIGDICLCINTQEGQSFRFIDRYADRPNTPTGSIYKRIGDSLFYWTERFTHANGRMKQFAILIDDFFSKYRIDHHYDVLIVEEPDQGTPLW